MRFRLHNKSASTGQVATNTAALGTLLQRVDELESAGGTSGGIEIITGVNDTFIFRVANNVYSESQIDGDVIHPTETYTLVLAGRGYTPTEIVAALNVAIVVHDNEANSVTGVMGATTTVTLENGTTCAIRCTSAAGTTLVRAIDILDSSACETLGFVVGQSIGPVTSGDDLTLVATNEAVVIASDSDNNATSLVTTQVTGEYPVPTVGTLNINDAVLTPVTFADAFSNGISHAYGASIFNVSAAGDYTINIQLRVTAGTNTSRGLYWAICRRYKIERLSMQLAPRIGIILLVCVTTGKRKACLV